MVQGRYLQLDLGRRIAWLISVPETAPLESGKFTPTYTAKDFINALEALNLPTTAEVADHVGCAHRTALHHLNDLEESGRITSREAGRAKLWMLANSNEAGDQVQYIIGRQGDFAPLNCNRLDPDIS